MFACKHICFPLLLVSTVLLPSLIFSMQANTALLMVRPFAFGENIQTAGTNSFQESHLQSSQKEISEQALLEFDKFVNVLQEHLIDVHVISEGGVSSPDSIFPNNWFSIDPHNGVLVLYPMMAENRRLERNQKIIEYLCEKFSVSSIIDLSEWEKKGIYLEGTGSIVFDYKNRKAYACLSPRTNKELFSTLCTNLGYDPITFYAHDSTGKAIYHTNVMMAIGANTAIICSDSITDEFEKMQVLSVLEESGKAIVDISLQQMNNFCGNVLQVENQQGDSYFVMSTKAYQSFDEGQLSKLEDGNLILHSPIDTIESVGGGGVRCMLGGVWSKK